MSIDQNYKIDFISTTPDGRTELTISDHLPWDDKREHWVVLQDKLNAYIQFIENGEVFISHPNTKREEIIICIRMKYPPDKDSITFLDRCFEMVVDSGIGFMWKVSS